MGVIRRTVLGDVLPCGLMAVMEGCTIGFTILTSTAMSRGMSPYVFVAYTNALSSLLLLPYSLIFHRDRSEQPIFTFDFFLRVFFLGLTGITIAQNLACVGLSYSSPIVACGMGNLLPAFSFILSILLRKVKFEWRSINNQAKVIGSLISIMGAVSLTVYKGPVINKYSPSHHLLSLTHERLLVFTSKNEQWILGCILFAAASFALSLWNIIQVGTIQKYPQVMTIVSFYSLAGTIQTVIFSIFVERKPSAWRLGINLELLVIVLTAVFGSVIRNRVQIWCMSMKGPFYVLMFKPLGIPIASTFGCVLFADTFHYGSMMSAFVVGFGYYTVMWGQVGDLETRKSNDNDKKVPLLEAEEVDEQV